MKPDWICFGDRKPELGQICLIKSGNEIALAEWENDITSIWIMVGVSYCDGFDFDTNQVTHWCPIEI